VKLKTFTTKQNKATWFFLCDSNEKHWLKLLSAWQGKGDSNSIPFENSQFFFPSCIFSLVEDVVALEIERIAKHWHRTNFEKIFFLKKIKNDFQKA
jgi:hypothetical protein